MKFAFVDTSIWINRIENQDSRYRYAIREHLDNLEKNGWQFCISDSVVMELLCKPIKQNNIKLINFYEVLINTCVKIKSSDSIFSKALSVMYTEKLNAMDSIHTAFAQEQGCELFVTTDKHFKSLSTIKPYLIEFPISTN